jgi:hypothetical protein
VGIDIFSLLHCSPEGGPDSGTDLGVAQSRSRLAWHMVGAEHTSRCSGYVRGGGRGRAGVEGRSLI